MESPASLFSAAGKMAPRPFAGGVLIVYALSFLSQALVTPAVSARWGVWAFALAQVPLIWAWFVLHARRLRDAGRSANPALAIAILYALAIVLLMLLVEPIAGSQAGGPDVARPRFADRWVLPLLLATLTADPNLGFFDVFALAMLALILVPIALALGFSIWAGTRPSATQAAAP